ncbi:hypothetical protein J2Y89_002104 [Curtobacterium herbarum]|uniref:hypothetical protein n=1 Tax=Curtobacterium herbarum TaxID=150122 RepID=UPI00209DF06C|nr:hypothetical protein [Curtobacterium herbarum]MCP1503360.1 hypothetical protein [Curtobacterium herbarum]
MSEAKIKQPRLTVGRGRASASRERRVVEDTAQRAKRQRHRGTANSLVIGARPRADLLPTEVLTDRRERRVVRRLWAGVVVVAVAVGIGVGSASLVATKASVDLAGAQAQTLSLLQQQARFKDVRATESATTMLESAQTVAGSTEIAWEPYLRAVRASLPAGVVINGVGVNSASPLEQYAQTEAPLQGQRVATLTFDAVSQTLPTVPAWLESVRSLPGYVDATVNSVTLEETSGDYTVNMTIHVNEKAFDGKYASEKGN